MRRRGSQGKRKAVLVLFGAALICLCFLSTKLMLIVLALGLIATGIWMLRC